MQNVIIWAASVLLFVLVLVFYVGNEQQNQRREIWKISVWMARDISNETRKMVKDVYH